MLNENSSREKADIFYGDPDFEFIDEEERELIESIMNSGEWIPIKDGVSLEVDSSFELPDDAVVGTGKVSHIH